MTHRDFIPLGLALLTISDTRTRENDASGDILEKKASADGHHIIEREIVRDDIAKIQTKLRDWIKNPKIAAIIATGSTGMTGRDCAHQAFQEIYEKPMPGFGETFRMLSYQSIGASTIQSSASAGVAGGTYLFSLPGSPGACRDGWDQILHHQLDSRTRPCNLVEILARLQEKK